MARTKKPMTSRQRRVVWILGTVEMILLLAAQADIQRRPADRVRGPKWRWRLVALVNGFGPLAYFLFGRKPATA